jgi:hypothetical protein
VQVGVLVEELANPSQFVVLDRDLPQPSGGLGARPGTYLVDLRNAQDVQIGDEN